MRTIHGHQSFGRNAEESLRSSTTLGSRIAEMGLDVSLRFKTIERGIDGADGYVTSNARFNFLAHSDAIGLIAETQKRQNDDVFKLSEVVAV